MVGLNVLSVAWYKEQCIKLLGGREDILHIKSVPAYSTYRILTETCFEDGADYHGDQSAKELAPLTWASLSV